MGIVNSGKAAAIEFGHPLNSNTHTDSAGGEACDNADEDMYKVAQRKGSGRDQDEPLLHGGNSSAGSLMEVFDDPSIQNGPNKTGSKKHNNLG